MILEARKLHYHYGRIKALEADEIKLAPGVTAILGPNAAGKSTLLRCLAGLLRPTGDILLNGQKLNRFSLKEMARLVAYLPQNVVSGAALTVFETVLLGRVHHLRWHVSPDDLQVVRQLLEEFEITHLGSRYISELSGGQAQIVFIAQVLARDSRVLLLDEPNANLDLQHQFEIGARIRALAVERQLTVAMSLHDINLAARLTDYVYVLKEGHVLCHGPSNEILNAELLADVYNINAHLARDAQGRLSIAPLGLYGSRDM